MLDKLYEAIIQAWMTDIDWLTTPWVYMTIIPACCYAVVMAFKWAFISLPIWLPVSIVFGIITRHGPILSIRQQPWRLKPDDSYDEG